MKKTLIALVALCAAVFAANAQDATKLLQQKTPAPDFTMTTSTGEEITLSDFKGSYVVLDFWATWCPDCRKENPEFKKLQERFSGYDVVFIGVAFDPKEEDWKAFVEKEEMNWYQVNAGDRKFANTKIGKDYGLSWIPTFYIIDRSGKIVAGYFTVEELAKALKYTINAC
ncbi:MAG: TlpA family protein disulfide reductase [Bacteroidales bacterium]|nr:TlpA family protein disulfide reductase [Bacteroidales bacterium]